MSPRTVISIAAAASIAAGCGSATEPATALVVHVTTDIGVPADMDRIAFRITTIGEPRERVFDLIDPSDFPVQVALEPNGQTDVDVDIEVIGLKGDDELVHRHVASSFVSREVRLVRIALSRSCVQRTCDAGLTCIDGACVNAEVDPSAFPLLGGAPDSGTPPRDARADARPSSVDSGGALDARAVDGGVQIDAALAADAPSPDSGIVVTDVGVAADRSVAADSSMVSPPADTSMGQDVRPACPVGDPCSDRNACTTNDRCQANGVCLGSLSFALCNDSNPCTTDICSSMNDVDFTCENRSLDEGAGCDDGYPCTLTERCEAPTPGATRVCRAVTTCGSEGMQCCGGGFCAPLCS